MNFTMTRIHEAVFSIIPVGIALDSVRASLESTVGSVIGTEAVLKALRLEAARTGIEVGSYKDFFCTIPSIYFPSGRKYARYLEDVYELKHSYNSVT
jgi:hypothetical protein